MIEPYDRDDRTLDDLAAFTRLMVESGDLEPWAAVLRWLRVDRPWPEALTLEQTHWLVALYNTYDDLGVAFQVNARWGSPMAWDLAPDRGDVVKYMPAQERRNLRGGRVLRRFDSYLAHLDGRPQERWLRYAVTGYGRGHDFQSVTERCRLVWGVGRQAGFEWAEFLAKVLDYPLEAPDAQLWESEGPRRALQRLYGNPSPSREWLEDRANECRATLETQTGMTLPWEDFETVICDFNVMRDGRYYPGKHLAALREELSTITDPDAHAGADAAFRAAIPAPWRDIAPGVSRTLLTHYRDTGRMVTSPCP